VLGRLSAYAAVAFVAGTAAVAMQTERVILVTVDGLRIEEFFGGIDPILVDAPLKDMAEVGIGDVEEMKERYWRDTRVERREALLPFFWKELAPRGVVLGDPESNSRVRVENLIKVSYPGYAEILTGRPQPRIFANFEIPSPQTTVLEFVQDELNLGYLDVAAFASWGVFNFICAKDENPFPINAGYEAADPKWKTPGMEPLNTLQFDMMTPWNNARFDTVTFNFAHEYLKAHEPKLLYIAFDETDDWGHAKKYDRVINAARYFDDAMKQLWATLQSMDAYRDKTTIVFTADHGRGYTPNDWHSHSSGIEGSEFIWLAVIGPDTPDMGVLSDTKEYTQGQVGPTVAKFFGLDYSGAFEHVREPIDVAFD